MNPPFSLDPTLISAVTAGLETAINSVLRYDPATRARVGRLQGKCLAVDVSELNARICVYFEAGEVAVSTYAEAPDTLLQGTLPALIRVARGANTSLAAAGVKASGDIDLLLAVRALVSDMEIDWEEAINDKLGDIFGHQLAQGLRSQMQWLQERGNNSRRLLAEFLTEELRAVPSAAELQYFNSQVDELRLDCDRLQARIERLGQALAERDH